MADRSYLERLSRELAENGLLIEAGWVSYRMAVIPGTAPKVQLDECHMAFFAGAQHLFSSLMNIMDPGEQETEADLRKMDLINKELQTFGENFELILNKAKGSA